MLTLILGTDWTANRDTVLNMVANDIKNQLSGRILLVPELISHDMERRLCKAGGDTASRFAEVLSFTRLTRRICDWSGCGIPDCMDNGGRLVAMASAARGLHSQLKAYASVETRPEFLTGLVDAVDEFKRCCISSQDLSYAATLTDGAFAQKLEELSLLLEAYEAVCSQGLRDPRDLLTWGLEQLQYSDFAQAHTFYIDGFPDFTRQNMAIIAHLIGNAPQVTISLNCDKPSSNYLAFEKAGDTAAHLLRIAQEQGVPVQIKYVAERDKPLRKVAAQLFQGKITNHYQHDTLRVCQADTIYDECVLAAEQILELVHNGARYRDISVVCPDLTNYSNAIRMHFALCGIPSYLAGTEDILEHSSIGTVLAAIACVLQQFEQNDVIRYLKSALSPVDLDTCDKLENYALQWGIQGKKWLEPWTWHPQGLQDNWQQQDIDELANLNAAREHAIAPLKRLHGSFHNAAKLCEQVDALYDFLIEIKLNERLSELASQFDRAGDNRSAQILNQHWEILLSALEQLSDMLGQTSWDNDTFLRLFRLLLSQYDVGTIPPVLDTVTTGSISAMRCQEPKHLIVIGAGEGYFPKYGSIQGVLSDQERTQLRQLGIPLTGGSAEGLQIEFSEIYGVFCGATDSIYVSSLSNQPSFVFRRLAEMAEKPYVRKTILSAAAVNPREAAAYLCRMDASQAADALQILDAYREVSRKCTYTLGKVDSDTVQQLYGKQLNLSASQIDKQADCRLAYFLKYGLRAQERKEISVDPAEFGTYVHAVLEETGHEICQLGGFKEVSLEHALQIAQKHSEAYTEKHFSQLDSERITYLFRRNVHELMMVVEELWEELQNSSFVPMDFEVAFGDGAKLPAIPIHSGSIPAQLRGFVDRVDVWQEDGRNYYRVVDYKTGRKDFDYCDIQNGLGLQMLLYLFALQERDEFLGEHPVPAGVQYFPARVPIISTDSEISDEDAITERRSQWKRKGLILGEDDVLFAMENTDIPVRLNCKRKKDGTLTGDVASRDQFALLSSYVFKLLGKMVDEIASGNVDPNPYTRGSSHNACYFCPYGTVCHSTLVEGRRNYKTVSAQKFWEEIEKEAGDNG